MSMKQMRWRTALKGTRTFCDLVKPSANRTKWGQFDRDIIDELRHSRLRVMFFGSDAFSLPHLQVLHKLLLER